MGNTNERTGNSALAARKAILSPPGQSLEVTGLGVIASLLLTLWVFVDDGTLPLPRYLIFASLMLIAAGCMAWRIWARGRA